MEKKLYLNVIRGRIEVRDYKTIKNVLSFTWSDVCKYLYEPDSKRYKRLIKDKWYEHIGDIYDFLTYGLKVIYTDNYGMDKLTDKGLEIFWHDKRKRED